MSISWSTSGSFNNTESFLQRMSKLDIRSILESAGREGVAALAAATPVDSGLAANSWGYEIHQTSKHVAVVWTNSDVEKGFPVVLMLQYGYATGTGGYVHGRDFINPAMQPIFDRIANEVWKAVISL